MTDTFTDANGLIWRNGGETTDDHLSFGGHETTLLEICKSLLPENGAFLDVGAHVGLYSLNLASKAGTVYAIEANPKTYDVLLDNIKANAAVVDTVKALNMAAWDKVDALALVDANDKETGGSTRCVEDGTPITKAIPLDYILSGETIDLVKIDVEGAEARVLRGMSGILAEQHPVLFIEMHDKVYNLPDLRDEVLEILETLNYAWDDSLTYGPDCYYIIAQLPNEELPEIEVVHLNHEAGGYSKFISAESIGKALS